MMNLKEMYEICLKVYEENEWDYDMLGVRFEDKEREIGEICECSKDNPDRDDERDFPEFGTKEYNELPELGGTSAWHYDEHQWSAFSFEMIDLNKAAIKHFNTNHAYIIASNHTANHPNRDEGEIVLEDAIVLTQLF